MKAEMSDEKKMGREQIKGGEALGRERRRPNREQERVRDPRQMMTRQEGKPLLAGFLSAS